MLSFAQQNTKYSLQTREKSSWKTLGGSAHLGFSTRILLSFVINIYGSASPDLNILLQYIQVSIYVGSKITVPFHYPYLVAVDGGLQSHFGFGIGSIESAPISQPQSPSSVEEPERERMEGL